jgi:hypothetical protein
MGEESDQVPNYHPAHLIGWKRDFFVVFGRFTDRSLQIFYWLYFRRSNGTLGVTLLAECTLLEGNRKIVNDLDDFCMFSHDHTTDTTTHYCFFYSRTTRTYGIQQQVLFCF